MKPDCIIITTLKGRLERLGSYKNVFENTRKKRGDAAPSALPLNPPMLLSLSPLSETVNIPRGKNGRVKSWGQDARERLVCATVNQNSFDTKKSYLQKLADLRATGFVESQVKAGNVLLLREVMN